MKGQGLNDLPRRELERRSSHHKGIFFEVPNENSGDTATIVTDARMSSVSTYETVSAG
jgi:hypothetical protein